MDDEEKLLPNGLNHQIQLAVPRHGSFDEGHTTLQPLRCHLLDDSWGFPKSWGYPNSWMVKKVENVLKKWMI